MSNRFVSDSEFAYVVANHFGLNVYSNEFLAVVNIDFGAYHFGQDNHVTYVGFNCKFFSFFTGFLGFAHFFEHLMFRGTPNTPPEKYRRIMVEAGARENASTGDDFTRYYSTFAKEDLDTMLALYADMFQNLSYAEPDFKTEARAILGEYNKNSANPTSKLYEILRNTAFDRHTYKHTTMGFLKDIEDMPNQYEYSRLFFNRYYRPEYTTIVAAGDGEVIFDGNGNYALFDVRAGDHHYFEGITFRNAEYGILAGTQFIAGSKGLSVKRSRFENVGAGVFTNYAGSSGFYIADNTFIGRNDPKHLIGWAGEMWRKFQGVEGQTFPPAMASYVAVKLYGPGHVVAVRLLQPVGPGQQQVGAPPRDRVGGVLEVEHAAARPRLALRERLLQIREIGERGHGPHAAGRERIPRGAEIEPTLQVVHPRVEERLAVEQAPEADRPATIGGGERLVREIERDLLRRKVNLVEGSRAWNQPLSLAQFGWQSFFDNTVRH